MPLIDQTSQKAVARAAREKRGRQGVNLRPSRQTQAPCPLGKTLETAVASGVGQDGGLAGRGNRIERHLPHACIAY